MSVISQEFKNAVYADRGVITARKSAVKHGITYNSVKHCWRKEMLRRGDPPLPPKGTARPKYSRELVEFLYSQRGEKSSHILAAELKLNRNSIIGLWNRERKRLGEIIIPRGTSPIKHLPRHTWPRSSAPKPVKPHPEAKVLVKRIIERVAPDKRKTNPFARLYGKTNKTPKRQSFSIREVEAMPVNEGRGVAFLDLPSDGCKFALGAWDAKAEFFCGSLATIGCYCAPHYAVCHAPTRDDLERLAA